MLNPRAISKKFAMVYVYFKWKSSFTFKTTLQVPAITDHQTGDLIQGLTHGQHFHGNGHGHGGRHGGGGHGDGFDAQFGNGWAPVTTHNEHHNNHHHNHDMEPNFRFHYSTYEIPVHGDVVSEKDAKKIGRNICSFVLFEDLWEMFCFWSFVLQDNCTNFLRDNFLSYSKELDRDLYWKDNPNWKDNRDLFSSALTVWENSPPLILQYFWVPLCKLIQLAECFFFQVSSIKHIWRSLVYGRTIGQVSAVSTACYMVIHK